jgi:enoyl-CoA hydratase/carnithine racemase
LQQPVVCAVHGYCIGSGVEIALFCDLRLAARGTVFAMPEVRLGMVPAAGGTQTVPRTIGPGRALDLLLTGRRIDAGEALALGLVTRVVEAEDLLEAATQLGQQLANGNRETQNYAKTAIGLGLDSTLADGLAQERRLSARLLAMSSSGPSTV